MIDEEWWGLYKDFDRANREIYKLVLRC